MLRFRVASLTEPAGQQSQRSVLVRETSCLKGGTGRQCASKLRSNRRIYFSFEGSQNSEQELQFRTRAEGGGRPIKRGLFALLLPEKESGHKSGPGAWLFVARSRLPKIRFPARARSTPLASSDRCDARLDHKRVEGSHPLVVLSGAFCSLPLPDSQTTRSLSAIERQLNATPAPE